MSSTAQEASPTTIEAQFPNGEPKIFIIDRPIRDADENITKDICPKTDAEKLVYGLMVKFLCKQEHRMGWAKKGAFGGSELPAIPNESVAAHQWGVAVLVMTLSRSTQFQEELPNFDLLKALEMGLTHDVAELVVGDLTPDDNVPEDVKHRMEKEAMIQILNRYPHSVEESLHQVYDSYETRQCIESKFVKDCDKLDFMLNAFLLERQGFDGLVGFITKTVGTGFSTKIAKDVALALVNIREDLAKRNLLYKRK